MRMRIRKTMRMRNSKIMLKGLCLKSCRVELEVMFVFVDHVGCGHRGCSPLAVCSLAFSFQELEEDTELSESRSVYIQHINC